ncbi:MAG: hypothetical protein A4E53_00822 [Pelotomaculum sp. PtaB.Bin104]|nr:MAG: hypothetical protein A4E53_00822 [Pelotomaculum sp. PtaB.Bin104]
MDIFNYDILNLKHMKTRTKIDLLVNVRLFGQDSEGCAGHGS